MQLKLKMRRTQIGKQISSITLLEKVLKQFSCTTIFYIAIIITSQTSVHGAVEWPVYFEHLGFVHSVHNKWDLALSVNFYLPALDLRLGKSLHRLQLLQGSNYKDDSSDEEYHDYVDPDEFARESRVLENEERNARNSDGQPSRLHELQESWATLNRHLRQRCITLKRRSNNLKGLGSVMPPRKRRQRNRRDTESRQYHTFGDEIVPSMFRNILMRQPLSRHKRQDEDDGSGDSGSGAFHTGIFKAAFGLAYDEDVVALLKRLNSLKSEYQSGIDTVNSQQAQLKSLTSSELNNQKSSMNKVMKMADKLDRKVADMETNPFLRSPIGNIVRSRTEIYNNLQLELDLVETRLAEIERMVTSLSAGRLDKNLISPNKLRQTLHNIEMQLPENYTLLFSPNDSLWPYYSLLSATASFDDELEGAMMHLSIPLIDLGAIMDLHRVHNLPLKVKDGYSVTADVDTEYLVTDTTRKYFLELHKDDFQDCQIFHYKGGDHFYCGFGPMLRADASARSCVMQLYQGTEDPTWCQSRLRHGLVAPFTRLYNGSWIFAALHDRFAVDLRCPDGNTPTSLMGFGVISLAEGCTITSHEFWYPHTFTGVISVNLDFGDRGWDQSKFHTDESIHDMMNGSHPHPPDEEHVQHHNHHHIDEHDRHDYEVNHEHLHEETINTDINPEDNTIMQSSDGSLAMPDQGAIVISNVGIEKRSTMPPDDSMEMRSSTEDIDADIATMSSVEEDDKTMMLSGTMNGMVETSSLSTPRLLFKNSPRFQKQAYKLAAAALELDGDAITEILAEMSRDTPERELGVSDLETILGTAAVTATTKEETTILNNMIVKLSENAQTRWLFGLS